jgi:hypothetical protein
MTIHVLVEGPSEREFFDGWGARLALKQKIRVHPHQGKGSIPRDPLKLPDNRLRGLLDQLPAKLRGFAASLDSEADCVLVVVDADNDDPAELAGDIIGLAKKCAPRLQVKVTVAVEEMEAFYLGDLRALKLAYPHADMVLAREYVPDSVCGTWELFGRVIGDDSGDKVGWAESMSKRMATNDGINRSPSFGGLLREVRALDIVPAPQKKRRRYIHIAKKVIRR